MLRWICPEDQSSLLDGGGKKVVADLLRGVETRESNVLQGVAAQVRRSAHVTLELVPRAQRRATGVEVKRLRRHR
jgi:hypothetical protein